MMVLRKAMQTTEDITISIAVATMGTVKGE